MPASGRRSDKNKKSLNTQRVVISDTQKNGIGNNAVPELAPEIARDISDVSFLEDTPAQGAIADKDIKKEYRSDKSKKGGNKGPKKSRKSLNTGNTEKRYGAKKSVISDILSAITGIFKKKSKTSNSSALEFAANRKRLGKKGRRNRRIFIYGGSGLAAAVLTLIIVFVPAKATPVDKPPADSPASTQGQYIASETDPVGSVVSGDPSVMPPVSPTPTQTPIVTTPPDIYKPIIEVDKEVEKFRVKADKYYNEVGYSNNHYKYTQEEKHMLSQVIYREARGEGQTGMLAVGNVVMNRVLSSRFPGTTIKAVLTTGQFAYYPDGKTNIWSNRAANLVLDYEQWVVPQNIFFFKNPPTQNWGSSSSIKYVMTIGKHGFYTDKKYGRTGMTPPKLFERTFEWPTMGCKPEDRVYRLQYMLNKLGYTKVTPDEYFGQDTKDAVIDFQKKHGLKADGIAGRATLTEIIKVFGEDNYYEKFCKD